MKNLFKMIIAGIILVIPVTVASKTLIIDFFDDDTYINRLGGMNGVWINNPGDKSIGCDSELEKGKRGNSLRLEYDIDAAQNYLSNEIYILDYSEFNIIGLANEIPHTASGGFYMLLSGIDLSEYKYLIFYAKGDEVYGFTRRFKLELKTKDHTASYIVDGLTNSWKRFVVPLSVFDKIDNWKKISELTIVIDETATDKEGVIFFDDFFFATNPREEPRMVIREKNRRRSRYIIPEKNDVLISGEVSMNYRGTPERGSELFHDGSLIIEGEVGRITGRLKVGLDSQEYGESAYIQYNNESPYTSFSKKTTNVTIETAQLNVRGLTPAVNKISIGNIWIGYSLYNISPFWGWKGISTKGNIGNFAHDTFVIKRPFNSFSLGNRSLYYIGDHRLKVTSLYDYQTAEFSGSDQALSSLENDLKRDIRPIKSEYSYVAGTLFRFLNNRLNCELNYGYYYYDKIAEADLTNPDSPQYSHKVSSNAVTDNFYEAKIFLDGLVLPGNKFIISYRDFGENFRPEYRQEPVLFDEIYADQIGYNARFSQWYKQYNVNVYWDDIKRKTNSDYYRRVINYGVGYLGIKGMELSINREIKRDKYVNQSLAINKDEEVKSIIAEFEYSIIYPITPGVRYPLTPKFIFREDKTYNKLLNREFIKHTLQIDLNFRLETDFGFSASYKTTRYADSGDDSDDDFEDNSLNFFFSLRF